MPTKTKKPTQIHTAEPKPPNPEPAPPAAVDEEKLPLMLDLTKIEYESLCEYLPILRNYHGCSTPAEAFITSLVRQHGQHHGPVTLEDVESALEEFDEDYKIAVRDHQIFQREPFAEARGQLPPVECPFVDLSKYEYQGLCQYLEIIRTEAGCNTPIEAFITDLVLYHLHCPLTPERVTAKMEALREDFADLPFIASYCARYYPNLKTEPSSAA